MLSSDAAAEPDADKQQAPPQRRHVVTAFVQRHDGKVLVVQRSDKVSTYQHKWGAISGIVEPGDVLLDRAYTEVEEEASIPRSLLQLVAAGRPLSVDDGSRHFLVHPFLLRPAEGVNQEQLAVALNWENQGSSWVEPRRVRQLAHVPQLPETLERVLLPEGLQRQVEAFRLDRSHGAAELAMAVVAAFRECSCQEVQQHEEITWEAELDRYRNFGYLLATCRPAMAAVANAAAAVLVALEEAMLARADPFEPEVGVVRIALSDALRKVSTRLNRTGDDLMHNCAALVQPGQTIMTLSYSSSLAKGIALAARSVCSSHKGHHSAQPQPAAPADAAAVPDQAPSSSTAAARSISAVICESRPLCEGVQLAAKLSQAGVHITVITDAQGALFAQQCDLVLLGSDAITAGGIVNKVGSLQLALAARHWGKPVYAVADTYKLSPGPVSSLSLPPGCQAAQLQKEQQPQQQEQEQQQGHLEEKGRDEVEGVWPGLGYGAEAVRKLSVSNVYFELVPWELLDGVVTERGLLSAAELDRLVQGRRGEYLQAFALED